MGDRSDGRAWWRVRLGAVVSIIVVVPLGLATKRFPLEGAEWIQANVGGALYVVFFCLAALVVWPRVRPWVVASNVTAATCGVEVLQLWHPWWLEAVRATTPGALVLGSTFVWADFPWYVVGGAVGLLWLWLLTLGGAGPTGIEARAPGLDSPAPRRQRPG